VTQTGTQPVDGVFDVVAVGLAIFDVRGKLVASTRHFAELVELPPEQLTPECTVDDIMDLLQRRGIADETRSFASLRAAASIHVWTARWHRDDGRLIDVGCEPLPENGWAISLVDVTPAARAVEEARRRARLLDSVLLAVPHGICVYGPERRVMMFNQTYQEVMAGAPLQVGDHLTDVIGRRAQAGEYGEGLPDSVFARETSFDISRPQIRRRVRPNGATIDIRTAPLPDGGHVSVVTDMSALAQAEAALRRRAAEMSVMLDSVRHGIVLWDANGRLVASNEIAGRLLDLPSDMLTVGRQESDVVDALLRQGQFGSGEEAENQARSLMEGDWSGRHGKEMKTRSGRVLYCQFTPARDGGWVSTYSDVTEAQAAAAELRRATEVAEAANQSKSRFLATMSHELRTPLNAIIGFSDALSRETGQTSAAQVKEYGAQINAAGKQLLALINIILDVARIETGRFEPSDVVDVTKVLRGVARHADSAAQAAEVTLRLNEPDELPPVWADERRLTQALSQLVSNAIKFTEAGGLVTLDARLTLDRDLVLRVADTGIGIPATELERVFEPFTQVDETLSRRYGGAGLGLYTARAIVNAQGGHIKLSSQPGIGTIAEIILPARRIVHQTA